MDASKEFSHLLAARVTLFWVVTQEERRVERMLASAQIARKVEATRGPGKFLARFWDCASGCTEFNPSTATFDPVPIATSIPDAGEFDDSRNPQAVFNAIRAGVGVPVDPDNPGAETRGASVLWILRDLDAFLRDPSILRGLRTLAHDLEDEPDPARTSAVVVLTTSDDVPACLRDECSVIRWPLPSREEVTEALTLTLTSNHARVEEPGTVADAVEAALGLTMQSAHDAFCYSIVSSGRPARVVPSIVAARKKAIVDREGVLTWFEPEARGLEAVGGLGELKRWLGERRAAFTPEARAYGLPAPRGIFLCGPPGNGKSLTAKAVASAFGWPLLRLDFGRLKGGLVGQSEGQLRKAFEVADAVGRVVLWADEIEKALAGSTGYSGYSGDSGVSADQLGHFLFWLQERTSEVFVVATANDPTGLPPELTRKGRFDEIFYVDLPNREDRLRILATSLDRYGCETVDVSFMGSEIRTWLDATEGFSGAEIAELVPSAMFVAFSDRARPLRTADLVAEARVTVPVSKSAAKRLGELREWAKTRARPAALPEAPIHQPAAPRPVARMVAVESGE